MKFIEANSPTELLYNAAECDFDIVLAAGSLTVHRGPILFKNLHIVKNWLVPENNYT